MVFVVQWLWYLLAFVAGSAVAWAVATRMIKRVAAKRALAGMTGHDIGARR